MAHIERDGEAAVATADLELRLLEQQLEVMERQTVASRLRWPWVLVIVGLMAIVGLGAHGSTAYATVARINVNARIDTANPVLMFQDVATNGPKVGSTVESSSRSTYTKALEQFLLDGTGVILGVLLVMGGLFVRVNP
jgi:hypothetical protein